MTRDKCAERLLGHLLSDIVVGYLTSCKRQKWLSSCCIQLSNQGQESTTKSSTDLGAGKLVAGFSLPQIWACYESTKLFVRLNAFVSLSNFFALESFTSPVVASQNPTNQKFS